MDTILIFDDDPAALHGIGAVLRSKRYGVIEASSDSQAVELGMTCGPLALLVTNIDLRQSSSTEVALKLVAAYPTLPVLLIGTPMVWWMSHEASNFKPSSPTGIDFLEKPFSVSELLNKVRILIGETQPRTVHGRPMNRAAA